MNTGMQQGYFIGLFFRFLWNFAIAFLFQTLIFYIFGYNFFTYFVLTIVFSFFINTSLPIKDRYPFFRHLLIYLCLYVANAELSSTITDLAKGFYDPSTLWKVLIMISVVAGIMHGIGRYGNGIQGRNIENFSNLTLLALIIIAFVTSWWEGGLVYLLVRIPMMIFEVSIANTILYYTSSRHSEQTESNQI
ncbi:hypothetical protein [Paenibacillus arenilitoris]|uniref:Uncharacterized protein n=1 Tax=Paenibacillus arenilitoris TaxID=2772299 RepID=A0A927CKM7_9BACL|nr:hypothetical protein [Paenibacillus arenilitoris]MBD2869289.1 hypothetical protein [Paenibacillus arenilitoris]